MNKRKVIYSHPDALTCPVCDGQIEVETRLSQEEIDDNYYTDGDAIYCMEEDCKLIDGQIVNFGDAYASGEEE